MRTISHITMIQLLLIVAKITGVLPIDWFWILLPLVILLILVAATVFLFLLILLKR